MVPTRGDPGQRQRDVWRPTRREILQSVAACGGTWALCPIGHADSEAVGNGVRAHPFQAFIHINSDNRTALVVPDLKWDKASRRRWR